MQHSKVITSEILKRIIRFSEIRKNPLPVMTNDNAFEGYQRLNPSKMGDEASQIRGLTSQLYTPYAFQNKNSWDWMSATGLIVMIPVFILSLTIRKHFVQGKTMGAVK